MEWKKSQYGWTESLSIGDGFISIQCYRKTLSRGTEDPKPFAYKINGNKGKTEFADIEDCKRWALDQARSRWVKAGTETGWLSRGGSI